MIKEMNREVYGALEVKIQKLVENTTNKVDLEYEEDRGISIVFLFKEGISIVEVENQKSLFKL